MLRKYLYNILTIFMLLPLLEGCTNDYLSDEPLYDGNGELIVSLECIFPGEENRTRTAVPNAKTEFVDKDVIQVCAVFTFENGATENGYGAFQYSSATKSWEALAPQLTWPNTAVKGKFEAYYMPGATGAFKPGEAPATYWLDNLTNVDPLHSEWTAYMDYGHSVKLDFKHQLTYLTLTHMPSFSNYWFTATPKETENGSAMQFYNQVSLGLNADNTFDYKYIAAPIDDRYKDTDGKDLIYINGTYNNSDQTVSFFLVPGFYEEFSLLYPGADYTTYTYLNYRYSGNIVSDPNGEDVSNSAPMLEAGYTYTLNALYSQGVEIIVPPEQNPEQWDESENWYDVNVEEFLKAARDGKEYINDKGTLILKEINGGVQLMHNVDFKNEEYTVFDTFYPDIQGDHIFDGNYHYIKNLGSPLFYRNYGTVRNLGLKGIEATVTSIEKSGKGDDLSHTGVICRHNQVTGIIDNIRMVGGVKLTCNIELVALEDGDDSSETHNMGLAVGWNQGRIENLNLSGDFALTVNGSDIANTTVTAGGIVGQTTGGIVSNITALKENGYESTPPKIVVNNKCSGEQAAYYFGGIIGYMNGANTVSDITMGDITVNCTASEGMVSYLGGLAGAMEVSGGGSTVNSCSITGTVRAGTVLSDRADDLSISLAYTGGMAGSNMNTVVTNCTISFYVHGPDITNDYVAYATGGGFGNITYATDINNSVIAATAVTYPQTGTAEVKYNYAGSFAGILQFGQSWDSTYAGKNIYVNAVGSLSQVGHSFTERAGVLGKDKIKRSRQ